MFIEKGTKVWVNHRRKGRFCGIAYRDFDTETEEFYPIIATQIVVGMSTDWNPGDKIECRGSLCTIKVEDDNA